MTRDYLRHILLAGGSSEMLTSDDVEPGEIGEAFERTLLPVRRGLQPTLRRGTGYTARGTVDVTGALITVLDEAVPVALLGVSLTDDRSAELWRRLLQATEWPLTDPPPPGPWSALAELVHPTMLPDWLRHWAESVAVSLLVHSRP